MKKKRRVISKILCFMLMFLMAVQAAPQTVAGVGAALLGSDSGSQADAQNSVLPDADKGQWDVPLATENPNNVDMTIRNGLVYTDYVYEKITAWGYVGGYQRLLNGATQRWEDLTASAGPMISGSYYYDDVNGNWIDHPYITTAVKKSNGDYGIDKNILTPELIIGGSYFNIVELIANDANMRNVFKAAKPYFEHATMKIVADSCNSGMLVCSYLMENKAAFLASGGRLNANIPMTKYGGEGRYPSLTFTTQDSSAGKMENINIAFIDNTSPSIQKVDIGQNGNSLVVTLTTNENIRWAADAVRNDLNDIWLEVDLQVVGTDHTETVRVHVSGINCPKDYNGSSTIEFRGDLGVLADLDYKILDISNASIPKNDYPITFGAILMYALQKKDYNARNITLGKWDNENKKTVYETYNTTAICDTAGNPLNLETVVNWPINQKEIKNDSTFVRKIEFMSDKTLRGSDTKNAEGFMDDITRSDYFFGPNDEISPRLSLNQVLTDEEVASFRIKTNVKDKNGEYIWLSPKSTGKYQINNEEFMYIDFESFVLEQSMSADAQDGNQSYFEITEISCDIKTSPALVKVIPAPEKTLYIDLACPTVTVKSNSLEEPAEQDGYFKLDIEVSIEDTKIDGMLQSGVLEQSAYFYLSGGVNEKTRIYSVIDTESKQPASTSDYKTYVDLTPGDNKLQLGSMGLTSDSANRFFIHLLIPQKTNLFIKDFMVYVDVSDRVGNKTDAGKGYNIAFHIDREMPELNVTSISTVYTADSAITTVKVDATDFNNVRSLRYQWVESGNAYSDGAWEDAIIDEGQKVSATIKKEFDGTAGSVTYDMTLYIKCEDDRGNESLITQKEIKINIDKPSTVYEVTGDLSSPSTHPEITVKGPAESKEGNAGYTRVTVSPLNPKADWMYVTVVKSGEELDVFALDGEWYKVKTSGAMYTQIDMVDGETVTIDELKNYYGNVKISFENAYQDLTPRLGYMNEYITDGSYIADQNFLTARFASQDVNLTAVNMIDFGKVTDINGQILSSNGDAGEKSLPFASSEAVWRIGG